MSLGTWGENVVFESSTDRVYTFRQPRRSGEARWTDHEVYSGKPKSAFVGPGIDTLTLDVRLDYQRGVDALEELKVLRAARDAGDVNTLILGDDVVFDCVIRSIDEEHIRFDGNGNLLVAVVQITFREYVA